MTKNFSGAEIEGLVNSARSFAFNREVDVRNLNKQINEDNLKVRDPPGLRSIEHVACCLSKLVSDAP